MSDENPTNPPPKNTSNYTTNNPTKLKRKRPRLIPVHNSNTYTYLQELPNGRVLEIEARHNGTILSSRPYVSEPPSGGRKRTRKHHKKTRRTHKRRN